MKSIFELRQFLLTQQKRLHYGDNLQSLTEIARRAGIHRDTLYACLNGNRINERTQYTLSKAIEEIEAENIGKSKTKILSISIGRNGVNLNFGVGNKVFN